MDMQLRASDILEIVEEIEERRLQFYRCLGRFSRSPAVRLICRHLVTRSRNLADTIMQWRTRSSGAPSASASGGAQSRRHQAMVRARVAMVKRMGVEGSGTCCTCPENLQPTITSPNNNPSQRGTPPSTEVDSTNDSPGSRTIGNGCSAHRPVTDHPARSAASSRVPTPNR